MALLGHSDKGFSFVSFKKLVLLGCSWLAEGGFTRHLSFTNFQANFGEKTPQETKPSTHDCYIEISNYVLHLSFELFSDFDTRMT